MRSNVPGVRYTFEFRSDEDESMHRRSFRVLAVGTDGVPTSWWVEPGPYMHSRGAQLDNTYFPGGFSQWLQEWGVDDSAVQIDPSDGVTAAWMVMQSNTSSGAPNRR